jgi:hypothetical protein
MGCLLKSGCRLNIFTIPGSSCPSLWRGLGRLLLTRLLDHRHSTLVTIIATAAAPGRWVNLFGPLDQALSDSAFPPTTTTGVDWGRQSPRSVVTTTKTKPPACPMGATLARSRRLIFHNARARYPNSLRGYSPARPP